MKDLQEARIEIDRIDKEIAILFEQRMRAVEDVIQYKINHDLPIFDPSREAQVIEKNKERIKNPILQPYYVTFLQQFMDISKQYQKSFVSLPSIGYQGIKGAFGHIAASKVFPDHPQLTYSSFEAVFQAVQNDEIVYGIVPFENSFTGEVGEVLDLLKKYPLCIHDIYDLKVSQNLLAIPGTKLTDIKQVYSHHQALTQCELFLRGREWEVIPYPNTAMAAEYVVSQQASSKAAIASKETADIYGLEVLIEDINTAINNTTRFIIVSKKMKRGGNRFSLLFTVKHDAGQLAKVMQLFAKRGYNLENIKSRSNRNLPWQYYFYVEVMGDLEDDMTKQLLMEIQSECEDMKVLGSYQVK